MVVLDVSEWYRCGGRRTVSAVLQIKRRGAHFVHLKQLGPLSAVRRCCSPQSQVNGHRCIHHLGTQLHQLTGQFDPDNVW